jgi:hypothetical protein
VLLGSGGEYETVAIGRCSGSAVIGTEEGHEAGGLRRAMVIAQRLLKWLQWRSAVEVVAMAQRC